MKLLQATSNSQVVRADETLVVPIDISLIHAELLKSIFGINDNLLTPLGIIAFITIDGTIMGQDARDVIIVSVQKVGTRYVYNFELTSSRDIQIENDQISMPEDSAFKTILNVFCMGSSYVDVKVVIGNFTNNDVAVLKGLYNSKSLITGLKFNGLRMIIVPTGEPYSSFKPLVDYKFGTFWSEDRSSFLYITSFNFAEYKTDQGIFTITDVKGILNGSIGDIIAVNSSVYAIELI